MRPVRVDIGDRVNEISEPGRRVITPPDESHGDPWTIGNAAIHDSWPWVMVGGRGGRCSDTTTGGDCIEPGVDIVGFDEAWGLSRALPEFLGCGPGPRVNDNGAFGDLSDVALPLAAACGILSSLVPYVVDVQALRRVSAVLFGTLASLNPVWAALAGWVILDEALAMHEQIGIAIIVLSNVIVSARGLRTSRIG